MRIVQKRRFHFKSLGLSIRDVTTNAVAELISGSDYEMPIIKYRNENAGDTDDPVVTEVHLRTILVRTINKNITRISLRRMPYRWDGAVPLREQ